MIRKGQTMLNQYGITDTVPDLGSLTVRLMVMSLFLDTIQINLNLTIIMVVTMVKIIKSMLKN